MDFVAIDFETANARSDSACQIGITVVCNNQIIETQAWLIKPPYGDFNPFHVKIHGITPHDVADAPTFDELWKTIQPYFAQNNLLIAHNAGFDANVLFNTLKSFEIAVPELTIACTLAMARRTWVNQRLFGLGVLAKQFDIQFLHHDAGEDARACAEIALRILDIHNLTDVALTAETVDDIAERLGIYFGSIDEYGYTNCKCRTKVRKRN